MTEKVTEKAPDMEIAAKYHLREETLSVTSKAVHSTPRTWQIRSTNTPTDSKDLLTGIKMFTNLKGWLKLLKQTAIWWCVHRWNNMVFSSKPALLQQHYTRFPVYMYLLFNSNQKTQWILNQITAVFFSCSEERCRTYQGLSLMSGMGAQVKNTVTNRKDRLPHTSDRAPIRGALMKDRRPCWGGGWRGKEPLLKLSWLPGTHNEKPRSSLVEMRESLITIMLQHKNGSFYGILKWPIIKLQ